MDFSDIFAEYYSQYRGQGSAIPAFGDREFTTAIYLGNTSIRKWDRVDGTLWRELIVTAAEQDSTAITGVFPVVAKTIVANTLTYPAPTNMRKPPAVVRFYNGTAYDDITVIPPEKAMSYSDYQGIVWFEGGANKGYVMHVGQRLTQQYAGRVVDYVYIKKPTLLTIATDPSAIVPDMSDPGFMIQDMLVGRFANSKNGFQVKVADKNASTALMNMKIEDGSGTYGGNPLLPPDTGWGVNQADFTIRLP